MDWHRLDDEPTITHRPKEVGRVRDADRAEEVLSNRPVRRSNRCSGLDQCTVDAAVNQTVWLLMSRRHLDRCHDAVGRDLFEFEPHLPVEAVGEVLEFRW